jgi:hypothetical protein
MGAETADEAQRGPMHTPAPRTIGLRTTEVTYPGGTEYIRAVRADLRAVLDDRPRADDVILCASELAANAAQHSRSRLPGGTFAVRAIISPDHYARVAERGDLSMSYMTGLYSVCRAPGQAGRTRFDPVPA